MKSQAADDGPEYPDGDERDAHVNASIDEAITRGHVKQVGGSHYHSTYQHWDWVEDVGMPYLEGNATKYVVRWKSKNGREDLLKAKSYVSKILIRHRTQGVVQRACRYLHKLFVRWEYIIGGKATDELFFWKNDVEHWERRICTVLRTWQKESDLIFALELIDFLLSK